MIHFVGQVFSILQYSLVTILIIEAIVNPVAIFDLNFSVVRILRATVLKNKTHLLPPL
jgi:hypothetical protein